MNTLIIGGLLGLAVLAILGAILLGISEERAEKAQKANAAGTATALLPQQSQSRQSGASQAIPATPVLVRPTGPLPDLNESASFASLNGQAREITSELRVLARRAGELEQRLNELSELLESPQLHQSAPASQLYTPETDPQAL